MSDQKRDNRKILTVEQLFALVWAIVALLFVLLPLVILIEVFGR